MKYNANRKYCRQFAAWIRKERNYHVDASWFHHMYMTGNFDQDYVNWIKSTGYRS